MSIPIEIYGNIDKERKDKRFNLYIYVEITPKVLKRLKELDFPDVNRNTLTEGYFYLYPNRVRYSPKVPRSFHDRITSEEKALEILMTKPSLDISAIYGEL